jgi:hypothetical protein
MGLSLQSLFQPLNDFFLDRFQTDATEKAVFRFDKFGSVLSDDDFIDPSNPEGGYSGALATEKFSSLTNRIPLETNDELSVVLSGDSIDGAYLDLLGPALPHVPENVDEPTKQAFADAFNTIKADAVKRWNNVTLESSSGLMLKYKPSVATPEDWYDSSKKDAWTSQSFDIDQPASTPADGANQLWKLKLSDAAINQVLELPQGPAATPNPPTRVLEMRRAPPILDAALAARAAGVLNARIAEPSPARVTPLTATRVPVRLDQNAEAEKADAPATGYAVHDIYLRQFQALNVRDRLLLNQFLGENAPSAPVETNSIHVSFDYCLVGIQRPWYADSFVNQPTWWIPGIPQGSATASDAFALLPIGVVAIRNLVIEANWTVADLESASTATDFGPFTITSGIVNGKLVHPGLQTIGWLLQRMPPLPPNDPPGTPTPDGGNSP